MGARPNRKLPGGTRLLETRTPARNPRRVQVLPPRHDRALPRPKGRGAQLVQPRAGAQPAFLAALGTRGKEACQMRRITLLAVVLAAMLAPAAASAHPLGNVTTNHYSRVVASGDRIYVLYVLDLAELPTFQAEQDRALEGGVAGYATRTVRQIAGGLTLTIDGRRTPLQPLGH